MPNFQQFQKAEHLEVGSDGTPRIAVGETPDSPERLCAQCYLLQSVSDENASCRRHRARTEGEVYFLCIFNGISTDLIEIPVNFHRRC